MRLATESIVMHESAQSRVELDWVTIMSYAEDMRAGDEFPPVVVFHDGETYWLADGFHRVRAALETGAETIAVDVHHGTLKDARWYSYSANQKQALRRTNADKRQSTIRAIKDWPEQYPNRGINYSEIARHVGVPEQYPSRLARETQCKLNNVQIAPSFTKSDPIALAPAQPQQRLQPAIVFQPAEEVEEEPQLSPWNEQEQQDNDTVLAEARSEVAEQELWEEDQVLMQSAERVIVIDPYLADKSVLLATIAHLQAYLQRKD